MVTSRDVARAAGLSQSTVSRVLAGSDKVTDATRERVLRAIEATGYVPDLRARSMRTSRTGMVGVVVAELNNPYYAAALESLHSACSARGWRMLPWVSERGKPATMALRAIRERSLDGLIFAAVTPGSVELKEAVAAGDPIVLMNRTVDGFDVDTVVSANAEGGALIARHFLAHGRSSPVYIGGFPEANTTRDRLAGFAAALAESGKPLADERIALGEYSYESGYDSMRALASSQQSIDAVFCANDLLAFGAIDAIRDLGLRIPEDIWVAGYDDVGMASWRAFDLTSVHMDVNAVAEHAADLLAKRLADPSRTPRVVQVVPQLKLRGSAPA